MSMQTMNDRDVRWRGFAFRTLGAGLGVAVGMTTPGCEPDEIAQRCGLDVSCENGGFAAGKASISGVPQIDAFFGAAIDLDASMRGLSSQMRAELDAMAVSVGLQPGAGGAEIRDAVQAHIAGYVDGGLQLRYQPAKCSASLEASVAAAAECDAEVDPGQVSVRCEGSCTVEASAGGSCEQDARLVCSGTAPNLDCSMGTCSGSCSVEVDAMVGCTGTCRGTCTLDGDTEIEGFEGRCDGTCTGECVAEMSAGGSCAGKCEGQCEYTPPEGEGCESSASVRCEAGAQGSVACNGTCEGTAEPPSVTAECEATVQAKADASIECTPPTIDVEFAWHASVEGQLDAQAEFRAWLEGFRARLAAIVAMRAKADVIVAAAGNLSIAAEDALRTVVDDLALDGNLAVAVGAKCALEELPIAAAALREHGGALTGQIEASATVLGAFGG